MKRVLYLDFEGSHSKGIREIGYLIVEDDNVVLAEEKKGEKAIKCLFSLQKDKFKYIVAHNAFVEKNLIKKYFPYYLDTETKNVRKQLWLDSLFVYRSLYPGLEKYDLKYLVETFIHPKILESEITKRCYPNAKTFHNPLFDAVCAYLLIKRLSNKINLNQFLHQEL